MEIVTTECTETPLAAQKAAKTVLLLGVFVFAFTAAAERPALVVNEDNDHFFKLDPSYMTREGLRDYVDHVARGHVTHFFMCVSGQRASFDSKTVEPIWEGIGEPCGDGQVANGKARRDHGQSGLWAVNAKMLFDMGIDPYEVWTARCREKGVSPWVDRKSVV